MDINMYEMMGSPIPETIKSWLPGVIDSPKQSERKIEIELDVDDALRMKPLGSYIEDSVSESSSEVCEVSNINNESHTDYVSMINSFSEIFYRVFKETSAIFNLFRNGRE